MRTKSPSITLDGMASAIDNLYDVVRDYVKEHQGEKGYINTNSWDKNDESAYGNDTIYGAEYCAESNIGEERIVYAVRVVLNQLQVLMRPWLVTYDNAPTEEELKDDNNWDCVRYGEICYFHPTLFNIAESIEQYCEE